MVDLLWVFVVVFYQVWYVVVVIEGSQVEWQGCQQVGLVDCVWFVVVEQDCWLDVFEQVVDGEVECNDYVVEYQCGDVVYCVGVLLYYQCYCQGEQQFGEFFWQGYVEVVGQGVVDD